MAHRIVGQVAGLASLLIAGICGAVAADPPTAEECLCRDAGKRPGAPEAEDCYRTIPFPPLGGYSAPPGTTPPFASVCWGTHREIETGSWLGPPLPEGGEGCDPLFDLRGYAPSIYTKVGVLQGDYLPVSHHASVSTHPLAGAGGVFHGPLSTATRPALNDVVDLITGQPLIRESDFELPFGTTVFRHIRTYSQIPMFTRESSDAMDYPTGTGPFESGLWWDVTGYGWMVGHSPLLLIDAAYAGWDTGEPYDGEAQNHIERCIFLPDAHRAIPFMSLGEDGRYEAPPRFDAVLSHNGDPADFESNSGDRHHWEEFPTEWNVWLQNRGLKYTMKPVYDDMQVNSSGVSLNQYPPPATQSHLYGRPFYGVATRIEDPQGNRIEIDYCSFEQKPCGSSSDGCANCCQACSAKGTIDQVRLVVGGASNESPEIVYRLVYVYREGSTFAVSAHDTGYPDMTQPVLHEIYVLPGDVEVDPGCRTIEREVFDAILDEYEFEGEAMECFAELSQITWADQPGVTDEWLDEWVIRVRYSYVDDHAFFQDLDYDGCASSGPWNGMEPRLVQASVTTRAVDPNAEVLGVNRYTEAVRADVPILTSRFVTDAAAVVDLYLEGQEKPIGVTPNHRVFSADRGTWIEAGELRAGERLASAAPVGDAEAAGQNVLVVARVEPREERVRVYNLEVSRYHTYFVGDQGVWVHNGCVPDEVKASPKLFKNWMQSKARTAFQNGSFIAKADLDEIVGVARTMGLKIGRVEQGVTGTVGKVWHIHIGGYHVPCPPNYTP